MIIYYCGEMIITIICIYSYSDAKKAYFKYDGEDPELQYKKLYNISKSFGANVGGSFDANGFNVPLPKEPLGEIGGVVFKAVISAKIVKFTSKLERNYGEQIKYLKLQLENLEKISI
jgi:hypothetical protein